MSEFRAGAVGVEITPDLTKCKVPLHGYGARGPKPATGVHDPICAKVLVLERGDVRCAFVTMDILQIDSQFFRAVIEKAGVPGLTPDTSIMAAAHDHSAPAALEPRTKSLPPMLKWYVPGYCEEVIEKIADGLRRATEALAPAHFAASVRPAPGLVRNRRVPAYDYARRTFHAPEGPGEIIDNELAVLHFTRADGAPIATLVNLAAHATVLGADNMLISADWPGYLQRAVERDAGGVCLYANGAQGNVAPDCGAGEQSFADAEKFGTRVAGLVQTMMRAMRPVAPHEFRVAATPVTLPDIFLADDNPLLSMGLKKDFALKFLKGLYPASTSLVAVRLDGVGITSISGEMLTELSVEFKKRAQAAGVPHPLIFGLANDAVGYMPSPEEYRKGGYEASMCFYGPELGTRLVDAAVHGVAAHFK